MKWYLVSVFSFQLWMDKLELHSVLWCYKSKRTSLWFNYANGKNDDELCSHRVIIIYFRFFVHIFFALLPLIVGSNHDLFNVKLYFGNFSDPSVKDDTPFKSCKSSQEIFCQDVSNEPRTRVMYDIKEQIHYDLWSDIDDIVDFKNHTIANKSNRFIDEYQMIKTLFVVHMFLYIFLSV